MRNHLGCLTMESRSRASLLPDINEIDEDGNT